MFYFPVKLSKRKETCSICLIGLQTGVCFFLKLINIHFPLVASVFVYNISLNKFPHVLFVSPVIAKARHGYCFSGVVVVGGSFGSINFC